MGLAIGNAGICINTKFRQLYLCVCFQGTDSLGSLVDSKTNLVLWNLKFGVCGRRRPKIDYFATTNGSRSEGFSIFLLGINMYNGGHRREWGDFVFNTGKMGCLKTVRDFKLIPAPFACISPIGGPGSRESLSLWACRRFEEVSVVVDDQWTAQQASGTGYGGAGRGRLFAKDRLRFGEWSVVDEQIGYAWQESPPTNAALLPWKVPMRCCYSLSDACFWMSRLQDSSRDPTLLMCRTRGCLRDRCTF